MKIPSIKFRFPLPIDSSSCPPPAVPTEILNCQLPIVNCLDTRYLCLLIISISSRFSTAVFSAKADSKIQPIPIPAKYFFKKIFMKGITLVYINALHTEKFFVPYPFRGCKSTARRRKTAFFGTGLGKNVNNRGNTLWLIMLSSKTAPFMPARGEPRAGLGRQGGKAGMTPRQVPHFFNSSSILLQ